MPSTPFVPAPIKLARFVRTRVTDRPSSLAFCPSFYPSEVEFVYLPWRVLQKLSPFFLLVFNHSITQRRFPGRGNELVIMRNTVRSTNFLVEKRVKFEKKSVLRTIDRAMVSSLDEKWWNFERQGKKGEDLWNRIGIEELYKRFC